MKFQNEITTFYLIDKENKCS